MPFQKGHKFGKGRPKVPEIQELREAIAEAKINHKKGLLQHFVDRAYKSDVVLTSLAKKLVPDLSASDLNLRGEIAVLPPILREKGEKSKEKDVKNAE